MAQPPNQGRAEGWPDAIPDGVTALRRIAVGGMAEVFEVQPVDGGPKVACKVLLPGADATVRKLFAREAEALKGLESEFVVGYVDSGDGFLLVDFIDGCDLAALNAHLRRRGRRFTPAVCRQLAHDLVAGAHALHEAGIVHRDLNPRNVMVGRDGRARIIDLGIAKRPALQQSTVDGLKGTLGFMAPEQLAGQTADRRTDVYALGLILYGVLTGTSLAADHASLSELMAVRSVLPKAPSALGAEAIDDEVVLKALAPAPADRWEDAGAMFDALGASPGGASRAAVATLVEEVLSARSELKAVSAMPGGTLVPQSTGAPGASSSSASVAPPDNAPPANSQGRLLLAALAVGVLIAVGVLGWTMGKSSAEPDLQNRSERRRAERLVRQLGNPPKAPMRVRVEASPQAGTVPAQITVDGTLLSLPNTIEAKAGVTRVNLGDATGAPQKLARRQGLRLRRQGRRLVVVARGETRCGDKQRQPLRPGVAVDCASPAGAIRLTRLPSRRP